MGPVGAFTKATWPKSYIDRWLNIYKGGIEVTPELGVNYVSVDDGMGNSASETFIGLGVGARYGISDKLEVLAAYQDIVFSPEFEAKASLTLGAGFSVVQGGAGGKLDIEAKAAFRYDLVSEMAFILAGADVRYKITPKIWIGTPLNTPGLVVTVKGLEVAFPGVPAQTISPIFFDLPLAVGLQATPELHVQLNTQVLSIAINDDAGDSTFFGADYIPLALEGLYNISPMLDAVVGLDLGELKEGAGDSFGVRLGVNARL